MTRREVAIIDGGGANIASLKFALERLGWTGVLTSDAAVIRSADRVILPGVGAARSAMGKLDTHGLSGVLPALSRPMLGICLGMQLLFESSEEEDTPCLGIIPGTVRRLAADPERPVPHMGWNELHICSASGLLEGIEEGSHCYFVHSYAAPEGTATVATTDYGTAFSSVVVRGNFMGTQFHPERSGATGSRILANFLNLD